MNHALSLRSNSIPVKEKKEKFLWPILTADLYLFNFLNKMADSHILIVNLFRYYYYNFFIIIHMIFLSLQLHKTKTSDWLN